MLVRARRHAAAALLPLAAGCHTYVPVREHDVLPPASVRVRLTPAGAASLEGALGPRARWVAGRLERRVGDTLVVALREISVSARQSYSSSGAVVPIALPLVAGIDVRRPHRLRTVAAGALGVGAAVLVYATARPRDRGEVPNPGPGPLP